MRIDITIGKFVCRKTEKEREYECVRPTNQLASQTGKHASLQISMYNIQKGVQGERERNLALSPIDIGFNDFRH